MYCKWHDYVNSKESNDQINSAINNISLISDTLSKVDFFGVIDNAKQSLDEVNMILYDIQHGDGTLTQLMQDSVLYYQVHNMVNEATRLVENIKTHPNRYLQFSIFGSRDQSSLDDRDERFLKKFIIDSLN